MDMNSTQPYPRGRWTSKSTLTDLKETPLRSLFWNSNASSESTLVPDAVDRLDLLLDSVSSPPPFLTGMDWPMPEAV
jgi:hypothetical protein